MVGLDVTLRDILMHIGIRWEKAGEKRARLYVPAIGALLGTPAFFMVIAVPNFYASMLFLFVE